jgi:S-formylglutathione hydrolase
VGSALPADLSRQSVLGHSMGGHGALVLALRQPGRWRAVSAFAPIAAPSRSGWGRKAFTAYLGPEEISWRAYDAAALVEDGARAPEILIDVGEEDPYLKTELNLDAFETACAAAGQPLACRRRAGYDHSYFFIASFIEEHLRWHAERLT